MWKCEGHIVLVEALLSFNVIATASLSQSTLGISYQKGILHVPLRCGAFIHALNGLSMEGITVLENKKPFHSKKNIKELHSYRVTLLTLG